jgi:GAF domain-containing protein
LFAQTEQARTKIEEQTRHLTQAGWEDFLNALERSERIGYLYDQTNLYPFNTPLPETQAENTVKSQIVVTGTPVGTLQLERAGDQPWQEDEVELVNAVVSQASRQLDNLRLLAQAESYRMEAEAAARRLTREGWAEYLQTKSEVNSFVYNHTQVTSLENIPVDSQPGETVVQPLKVGAEKVGELSFDGIHPLDVKTSELVTNVADMLTNHVESLRLTEQTQKALIETEDLYSASAELNTARTYSEILDVLRRHTLVGGKAHVVMIYLFNRPGSENDMPEYVEPAAAWNELELEGIMGRFSLAYFPSALATLHPNYPTLVEDVENDNRLDDAARSLYSGQLKSRSLIIAPLVAGGLWMGYITAGFMQTREFPPEEVRRMMALAAQAAVAINNLRLLDETQALAQREKNLRQITALVRGSTNADTILRTATRELGVVLGRKVKVQLGGNPAPQKPTSGNASKTSES